MITEQDLYAATGESVAPFGVDAVDIASGTSAMRILTFLDDPSFVQDAISNPHAAVVLASEEIADAVGTTNDIMVIRVPDPRWSFYTLCNYLTAHRPPSQPSVIHESARISPNAYVADHGVRIGAGVIVEPFATIHPHVELAESVIVRSGAVIGCPGFEHKRTSHGVLSVAHDGGVYVGARTEVGPLSNLAQGFQRRQTIVGVDTRIDSLSHVAHGCAIGDRVFLAAGVTVSGSVTVGSDAWIGPGATIMDGLSVGDRARVGLGSVVLKNVPPDGRVVGNPARGQIDG